MKTNQYVEDLRTKSATELTQELVAAKKELFNLKFYRVLTKLNTLFYFKIL